MGPRSEAASCRLCHASRRSKPKARTALRTQQRLPCAPMASPSFVSGKLKTHSNMGRQRDLEQALGQGQPPTLSSEDVARGLRVDVWDDTAKRWESLHSRPNDDLRGGAGKVVDAAEDEGFIQGAAATESPSVDDSPIHVHEAIFGWEGWSLSARAPASACDMRTARRSSRTSNNDARPSASDPRYQSDPSWNAARAAFGRSYAMRAWLVDLAGNSRPHKLNPPPLTPARVVDALGPPVGRGGCGLRCVVSSPRRPACSDELGARGTALDGTCHRASTRHVLKPGARDACACATR